MEKKIQIAIVDDQPLFRFVFRVLVKKFPQFTIVSETENGKDFIESLKTHIPDVILLDMEMPEMDGEKTVIYLKKHHPQIKILMLTGYDNQELALSLMRKGINGFLTKDTSVETLKRAILSIEKTGYFFNKYITQQMVDDFNNGKAITAKHKLGRLSLREKQVVSLLCNEYINKEIADILFIGVRTVETHRANIIEKIGASTIAGVINYGLKTKLNVRFGYPKRVYR